MFNKKLLLFCFLMQPIHSFEQEKQSRELDMQPFDRAFEYAQAVLLNQNPPSSPNTLKNTLKEFADVAQEEKERWQKCHFELIEGDDAEFDRLKTELESLRTEFIGGQEASNDEIARLKEQVIQLRGTIALLKNQELNTQKTTTEAIILAQHSAQLAEKQALLIQQLMMQLKTRKLETHSIALKAKTEKSPSPAIFQLIKNLLSSFLTCCKSPQNIYN